MTTFKVYGQCPGALTPMAAADGLVMRIRPLHGQLTADQARGIAALSERFGRGLVELTSRANLQIRGIAEGDHPKMVEDLLRLGLIDTAPAVERARNIIVTPFHRSNDGTMDLAQALSEATTRAPRLPAKFGLAIDVGPAPVLQDISTDIRLERASNASIILRPDGASSGKEVSEADAPEELLALMDWFISTGGVTEGRGRMRQHLARGARLPNAFVNGLPPAPAFRVPGAGPAEGGILAAAAFGLLPSATLAALADLGGSIRMTPWRALFLPGHSSLPALDGLLLNPADAILRTHACTGAPGCTQAIAETRQIARAIAPHLPEEATLHVSGCAKGCAHPAPATATLVATANGFALIPHGKSNDPPERILTSEDLMRSPATLFMAP